MIASRKRKTNTYWATIFTIFPLFLFEHFKLLELSFVWIFLVYALLDNSYNIPPLKVKYTTHTTFYKETNFIIMSPHLWKKSSFEELCQYLFPEDPSEVNIKRKWVNDSYFNPNCCFLCSNYTLSFH